MSGQNMQTNAIIERYKTSSNLCVCALVACAFALAGCGQQQRVTTNPVTVPDIGKAQTMEVAEDVLARMHFTIEKLDVPSGSIRTRPLPGAQFFEFWRSDNVGGKNSLQANLHTIRRTVALYISQRSGQLQIDCDVRVQRLALPERDVSSSARAYGMYTRSSPSLQRMRFETWQEKEIAWIDLEKDTLLAAEILKRIEEQIASQEDDEPQMTENRT
jgi:hypothetical protein